MASGGLSKEDFSSPVCCDIYKDPVILPCNHSMCKGCFETSREAQGCRECPVCRRGSKKLYLPNLALDKPCEIFGWMNGRREAFCSLFHSVVQSKISFQQKEAARNLLKNPNGEEQMRHWELTKNRADVWKVEAMPGDCGHSHRDDSVKKYFITLRTACLKKQVVDLVAEGYHPEDLDAQPPVTVEDWYCGRTMCNNCTYQLTVELLDGDQKILATFKPADKTIDQRSLGWKQVTHTFRRYGRGLRFISFEHGAKNTVFLGACYRVRLTASAVRVNTVNPRRKLLWCM